MQLSLDGQISGLIIDVNRYFHTDLQIQILIEDLVFRNERRSRGGTVTSNIKIRPGQSDASFARETKLNLETGITVFLFHAQYPSPFNKQTRCFRHLTATPEIFATIASHQDRRCPSNNPAMKVIPNPKSQLQSDIKSTMSYPPLLQLKLPKGYYEIRFAEQ